MLPKTRKSNSFSCTYGMIIILEGRGRKKSVISVIVILRICMFTFFAHLFVREKAKESLVLRYLGSGDSPQEDHHILSIFNT